MCGASSLFTSNFVHREKTPNTFDPKITSLWPNFCDYKKSAFNS